MELQGRVEKIYDTETVGEKNFRKRDLIIVTDDQYPQHIKIQFVQDNCSLLDYFKVSEPVIVQINIQGRKWTNPEGVDVYFNTIQGWRIAHVATQQSNVKSDISIFKQDDEPPF